MITKQEILKASGAVTVGSVDGDAFKVQQSWKEYTFELDVTVLATDVDDTLDVYIDTSYDGGTTWINIAHFTQILGNGSAVKEVAHFDECVCALLDVTSDLAAGNVRSVGMGDNFRYRSVVVDPTGSNGSFTFSVKAYLKNGH